MKYWLCAPKELILNYTPGGILYVHSFMDTVFEHVHVVNYISFAGNSM